MKNEKIVASLDKLRLDDSGKQRILEKIGEKEQQPQKTFRPRLVAAIAAVLCLAIVAAYFILPGESYAFYVKSCAYEQQEDGSYVLEETDLLNQPDAWGGCHSGGNFYIYVGLRYEGKNIKSVKYSVADGFFARQYVDPNADAGAVSTLHVGSENRLVLYGDKFENVGNSIVLDKNSQTDDLLLFWGTKSEQISKEGLPEKIEITATATFTNGKTQDMSIVIPISGKSKENVGGDAVERPTDEQIREMMREEQSYYDALPLDGLEILPGSYQLITDYFYFSVNGAASRIAITDDMAFDENGILRYFQWPVGDEYYMAVVKREKDGTMHGMVYIIPPDLIYKKPYTAEQLESGQVQFAIAGKNPNFTPEEKVYLRSLPLDQCELVEHLTREYIPEAGGVIDETTPFDENGMYRNGLFRNAVSGDFYINIIRREAAGGYTEMYYRIPNELIPEHD